MRGIAGALFVFVGVVMAYLVLSGQLPSSTPLVSPTVPGQTPQNGKTGAQIQGAIIANKNIGSGPTGLPTMGYFHDLVASQGGMS